MTAEPPDPGASGTAPPPEPEPAPTAPAVILEDVLSSGRTVPQPATGKLVDLDRG